MPTLSGLTIESGVFTEPFKASKTEYTVVFDSSLKQSTVVATLTKGRGATQIGSEPTVIMPNGMLLSYQEASAMVMVPFTNSVESNPRTADLRLPGQDKTLTFYVNGHGDTHTLYTIHIVYE